MSRWYDDRDYEDIEENRLNELASSHLQFLGKCPSHLFTVSEIHFMYKPFSKYGTWNKYNRAEIERLYNKVKDKAESFNVV